MFVDSAFGFDPLQYSEAPDGPANTTSLHTRGIALAKIDETAWHFKLPSVSATAALVAKRALAPWGEQCSG